jgi:hypothetical protein
VIDAIHFAPSTPSGRHLIEPLGQIVKIKRNEIDDALPGNPEALSLLHLKGRAGIVAHNFASQDSHLTSPSDTRLPSGMNSFIR